MAFKGMLLFCMLALSLGVVYADDDMTQEEMEGINDILKKTDVLQMLKKQSRQQDVKLKNLHHRLEKELAKVNDHFDDLFQKLSSSERTLEQNLAKVEKSVARKIEKAASKVGGSGSGWKWPFVILFLLLLAFTAFFSNLYRKATKHDHLG